MYLYFYFISCTLVRRGASGASVSSGVQRVWAC